MASRKKKKKSLFARTSSPAGRDQTHAKLKTKELHINTRQ